jgi:alkanesulfonate monooxygenase SsuD/methylene tetrahydromethanopterin reductase-like flavin-dependent oxidoreductase (luciferase family)
VTGTPEEVAAKLQEFVDAGARHLILLPTTGEGGTQMLTRILAEIAPRVTMPE